MQRSRGPARHHPQISAVTTYRSPPITTTNLRQSPPQISASHNPQISASHHPQISAILPGPGGWALSQGPAAQSRLRACLCSAMRGVRSVV